MVGTQMSENDFAHTLPDVFGFTIFCDDVRFENTNKVIAVGIYFGGMNVNVDFPAQIKSFAMIVSYSERVGVRSAPLEIEVLFPGEEQPVLKMPISQEQLRPPIPRQVDPNDPLSPKANFHSLVIPIVMGPVTFKAPGLIRVLARLGEETIRLGALNILRGRHQGAAQASPPAETAKVAD
jgi:hypothetical protein